MRAELFNGLSSAQAELPMVRVVHGPSCPRSEVSICGPSSPGAELSTVRVVHGLGCLFTVRAVHSPSCPVPRKNAPIVILYN
jgi:hypothetical protein